MKRAALCTVAVLIVMLATSCAKKQPESTSPSGVPGGLDGTVMRDDATDPNHLSKTDPHVYFPMDVGTTWTYEISLGKTDPLHFGRVSWPQGGGQSMSIEVRGRYLGAIKNEGTGPLRLVLKVEEVAAQQGPLQFPEGVKLTVLEDELGIYEDIEEVFWAATTSDGFQVTEITTHSPDSSGAPGGAWGSYGIEPGYSMKLVFFAREPGTGLSVGEESPETLFFKGPEGNQLHFERIVEGSKENQSPEAAGVLNSPYTENIVFEKGKGLVSLEQKVDGTHSMTWKLVKFTPGIS